METGIVFFTKEGAMKTRSAFVCGFGCGMFALLSICLPLYLVRGWPTESSVRYPIGTVLIASQKRMTVHDLQAFSFLFDSSLSGDVDEVHVTSHGRLLCVGICMRADGPNTQRQFVFRDLLLKGIEKDGSLRFERNMSFQTASK